MIIWVIISVVTNFIVLVIDVKPYKLKLGNPEKLKEHKTPIYEIYKREGYFYIRKHAQDWVETSLSTLLFFLVPLRIQTFKWSYGIAGYYYIKNEDLKDNPIEEWTLVDAKSYYEHLDSIELAKEERINSKVKSEQDALKAINEEFNANYVGNWKYNSNEEDDYSGFR